MLQSLRKYAIMSKVPVGIKVTKTFNLKKRRRSIMKAKHVKTLNTRTLSNTLSKGGCGECQTSCQSACKTSCTVGNQTCEKERQRG